MIENMRKYTGLMAVVFILLAAGFLFTMNDLSTSRGTGMGSGPTLLEANGRALDQQEYRRMGDATLQLASETGLHSYVNFLMVPDVRQLEQAMQFMRFGQNYYITMGRNLDARDYNRFIANRIIVQQAIEELGIYASDEEVTNAIKSLPSFTTAGDPTTGDRQFDNTRYALFIDKRLGRLGMTEKDLREVVRENLCLNKLIEIVGGGLVAPRKAVREQLEARMQSVTLSSIVFNRDDFVEKEKPTEEEIKAYWEAHKDLYKSEEQRRINYVLLTPPSQPEVQQSAPAPELPPNATEEQKKAREAAEKTRIETHAKALAAREEAKIKAARANNKEIDLISQAIYDSEEDKKPLDFAAILEKRGHKVVETGLFTSAKIPQELNALQLRGNANRNKTLGDLIFNHIASSDNPYDLVSDALPVGENGWVIFTLEEVIAPELLDYAAARIKARAQLISENGTQKVKQAAKTARDEMVELMKSGKSFDEAAKEKGFEPVKTGPLTVTGRVSASDRQLHQKAIGLNPGEVSDTIDENDRSLFFLLIKREIEDTEQAKRQVESMIEGNKNRLMINTFLNWINHEYEKAGVKGPATEG